MSRAVLALALLLGAPASAAPRALVVEAVVGRDSSEVHVYLADVVAALGQPLADRALADAVDARFGPPPARLSPGALAELAARTRQAERNLFFNGTRARESIDELEAARARLGDAQATLAHDRDARALYQHVLLKLARAYQVTHGPEATRLAEARMQELVRNVSDLPIDPDRNERELVQLTERVRAAMGPTSRLSLSLPPGARAFVEGQPVEGARTSYAGDYRLFATGARGDGRLHHVIVARRDLQVTVDVDFEAALRSDRFVGLVYSSPSERAVEEARWVGQLARAFDAGRVYVLAADGADGRPGVGVWGYAVDERGARPVASSTAHGAAGSASAAEVARAAARVAAALDGGAAAPGVTVMSGRAPAAGVTVMGRASAVGVTAMSGRAAASAALTLPFPAASASAGNGARALTLAGWSAVAVGLPLAVLGAGLWHHGSDLRSGALVTSGAGLAVAGSVWTLATAAPHRPRTRAVAVVAALWGAAAVVAAALAAR